MVEGPRQMGRSRSRSIRNPRVESGVEGVDAVVILLMEISRWRMRPKVRSE